MSQIILAALVHMRVVCVLALALAVSATASAGRRYNVSPVPDGFLVDFTDIQSAINAAEPGDVIDVWAGTYEAFRVTKEISIIGRPGAVVRGRTLVEDLNGQGSNGQSPFVLCDLHLEMLSIGNCASTVILDHLIMRGRANVLWLSHANDVRANGVIVVSGGEPAAAAVYANHSRLELTQSSIYVNPARPGHDGVPALSGVATFFHSTSTRITGGDGGPPDPFHSPPLGAGDGADAVDVYLGCDTRTVGCNVQGGTGGASAFGLPSGADGIPFLASMGLHEFWRSTLTHASGGLRTSFTLGAVMTQRPLPALDYTGPPAPGLHLRIFGEYAATAVEHGDEARRPAWTMGSTLPFLVDTASPRPVSTPLLGAIPVSVRTFYGGARGSADVYQYEVLGASGRALSNSVSVVMR